MATTWGMSSASTSAMSPRRSTWWCRDDGPSPQPVDVAALGQHEHVAGAGGEVVAGLDVVARGDHPALGRRLVGEVAQRAAGGAPENGDRLVVGGHQHGMVGG